MNSTKRQRLKYSRSGKVLVLMSAAVAAITATSNSAKAADNQPATSGIMTDGQMDTTSQ